jgi:hypothetical protein
MDVIDDESIRIYFATLRTDPVEVAVNHRRALIVLI